MTFGIVTERTVLNRRSHGLDCNCYRCHTPVEIGQRFAITGSPRKIYHLQCYEATQI
ncbi:hypothetical protein [Candidatus Bathycorpusculum sp.]|uniref:hypothetical protein n=1 Tax=Candidatus Bathycorpusculum sp. TaxID=2994959 RepID=UPI00281F82A2|nr:hypothetical protein [Candidatus Termitimicrobium sp.]MCL2431924.1 hypothetical protein [Candidatus Termitimicrobium sp.]